MATRDDTNMTAREAYAERAADIARLLDLIRDELAVHAAQAQGAPTNWGYAGDLGKLRSDLIDAYRFISQKEFTR
jgi:hypothetical protein